MDEPVNLVLVIEKDLKDEALRLARERGTSLSKVVRRALAAFVATSTKRRKRRS